MPIDPTFVARAIKANPSGFANASSWLAQASSHFDQAEFLATSASIFGGFREARLGSELLKGGAKQLFAMTNDGSYLTRLLNVAAEVSRAGDNGRLPGTLRMAMAEAAAASRYTNGLGKWAGALPRS